MATLRLFASAREAAGTGRDSVPGSTVGEVLSQATARYGTAFAELLPNCRVWRNGEPAEPADAVTDADEVAVLPPVSGGAGEPTPKSVRGTALREVARTDFAEPEHSA